MIETIEKELENSGHKYYNIESNIKIESNNKYIDQKELMVLLNIAKKYNVIKLTIYKNYAEFYNV